MSENITCGERAVLDARQKALKVLRANFQRVTQSQDTQNMVDESLN